MSFEYPAGATGNAALGVNQSLISVQDLKDRYLFGLDLTDENGNEMPDAIFQHNIETAISFIEHELDIQILPRNFVERVDYRQQDYTNFNFIQLRRRPVCEVSEMKAKFPNNQQLVQYPKEWIVVDQEGGQVQLSPTEGSFNGLIITSKSTYVPLLYGTRDYWPQLFEINYKAGFSEGCIPSVINEVIGLQASLGIFEILGDIVLGPGVAGEAVSIDGASTSKNLTASAMYSAYSARIENYNRKLEKYLTTIRKYYSGIPMVIV